MTKQRFRSCVDARTARRLARALRRDERGTAVVEFGLWTTILFLVIMVALDFGTMFIERGKANEALAAAAVASFEDPDTVDPVRLQSYVRALANNDAITVTTLINGVVVTSTNTGTACSCLKQDGTYVGATCGNSCAGTGFTAGSRAGRYLTIQSQQSFNPMMLPNGMLSDTDILQRTTVRLK